ncbi:MAG: NfeD family protein [Oscillospiraceae bacterium]|nr:NfeD family protein [Oscillospiraceae bacterium]
MDTLTIFWFAAVVLFAVVEASTVALVSLWFVGGALAALIASLLGAELWLQIVLFVVVSGGLLACLRPFIKKVLSPRITPTNFDRIIGQKVPVVETIDNLNATGAVKAEGNIWSARSESGEIIEKDTVVEILEIQGVKVIVRAV